METIKVCPFCGGNPFCRKEGGVTIFWTVRCSCSGEGPVRSTEEKAIAAWNFRPTDAVLLQAQKVADEYRAWLEPGRKTCYLIDTVRELAALLPRSAPVPTTEEK